MSAVGIIISDIHKKLLKFLFLQVIVEPETKDTPFAGCNCILWHLFYTIVPYPHLIIYLIFILFIKEKSVG